MTIGCPKNTPFLNFALSVESLVRMGVQRPQKNFSVIDSKMTFREQFLVFKGIYKGEFSQIDFRHRHDQVVKRIREDWGQTQLSEELLRRIDGILDVNSVEHRVGT